MTIVTGAGQLHKPVIPIQHVSVVSVTQQSSRSDGRITPSDRRSRAERAATPQQVTGSDVHLLHSWTRWVPNYRFIYLLICSEIKMVVPPAAMSGRTEVEVTAAHTGMRPSRSLHPPCYGRQGPEAFLEPTQFVSCFLELQLPLE